MTIGCNLEIESLRFEPGTVAFPAESVGAIAAEKYAYMHFVAARFHPIEKPAYSIPAAALPDFIRRNIRSHFALDHPLPVRFRKLVKRAMDIDSAFFTPRHQVLLACAHASGLERLHDAGCNAQLAVWHRAIHIDADGTTKAATSGTCAHRIVE